jgi:hypothetical protein
MKSGLRGRRAGVAAFAFEIVVVVMGTPALPHIHDGLKFHTCRVPTLARRCGSRAVATSGSEVGVALAGSTPAAGV